MDDMVFEEPDGEPSAGCERNEGVRAMTDSALECRSVADQAGQTAAPAAPTYIRQAAMRRVRDRPPSSEVEKTAREWGHSVSQLMESQAL